MATYVVQPEKSGLKQPSALNESTIKFGVIGYGYWGPNVVRNLDQLEEAEVLAVCD